RHPDFICRRERIDMTTRNHTPRRWHVGLGHGGHPTVICTDPANPPGTAVAFTVAREGRDIADCENDARLIAAAPDLLAALQRLRDDVQTTHVGSDERCNDCAVCLSLKLADAALGKATY